MEGQQQFKRNTAFKLRIGDILAGKPVVENDRFLNLELDSKKVVRVNIIGNIVDKYESQSDKKYTFFTLDDGSGQIKLKVFGDDADKFKTVSQGQTVAVIGNLRHWNNETYITPEVIKEYDSKYLLVRKLELEKERAKNAPVPEKKEEVSAIKDKVLDLIKNSEEEGGIETDKIIMDLRDASPEVINSEIKKLLEEGIVFEPRPGKVRWLG